MINFKIKVVFVLCVLLSELLSASRPNCPKTIAESNSGSVISRAQNALKMIHQGSKDIDPEDFNSLWLLIQNYLERKGVSNPSNRDEIGSDTICGLLAKLPNISYDGKIHIAYHFARYSLLDWYRKTDHRSIAETDIKRFLDEDNAFDIFVDRPHEADVLETDVPDVTDPIIMELTEKTFKYIHDRLLGKTPARNKAERGRYESAITLILRKFQSRYPGVEFLTGDRAFFLDPTSPHGLLMKRGTTSGKTIVIRGRAPHPLDETETTYLRLWSEERSNEEMMNVMGVTSNLIKYLHRRRLHRQRSFDPVDTPIPISGQLDINLTPAAFVQGLLRAHGLSPVDVGNVLGLNEVNPGSRFNVPLKIELERAAHQYLGKIIKANFRIAPGYFISNDARHFFYMLWHCKDFEFPVLVRVSSSPKPQRVIRTEDQTEMWFFRERVQEGLAGLPAREKQAMELYLFSNHNNEDEVMETMGISAGTLLSYKRRGFMHLNRHLDGGINAVNFRIREFPGRVYTARERKVTFVQTRPEG